MPLCCSLSNGEMMNKNWWIRAFVSLLTTSWLWQPFDINSICCESGPLPLFWYLLLLISLFRKLSKIMLWKNYSSILLPKVYRWFEMHKTNLSSLIRLYLLLWPIKMFKIISHIFLAVQQSMQTVQKVNLVILEHREILDTCDHSDICSEQSCKMSNL